MEVYAYGNSRQMVLIKIFVKTRLINGLVGLGYLERDDFDIEAYFEVLDKFDSQEMAISVRDAVIDFYEDKVAEIEEKAYENGDDEEIEYLESLTDLEKIMEANCLDDFLNCIEIVETDPKNPYKGYF